MNTISINTTLDVLRFAAHALPGTTVAVAKETKPSPDGGTVFQINELDNSGELLCEGKLHVVVNGSRIYPIPTQAELESILNGTSSSAKTLASN